MLSTTSASDSGTTEHPARLLPALGRVLRAPVLVLVLWLLQLFVAKLMALAPRVAASASMGPWRWFVDDHRLRAIAELFADNPGVVASLAFNTLASAILAVVFWLVAAPALIVRLSGDRAQRGPSALIGACGRQLGPMITQSAYGLLFRGLWTGLALIPLTFLGPWAVPLAVVIASFPVLVLDRARVAVVLEGARPYHPMTFLRAVGQIARRPRWWLGGAVIDTLKIGIGVAALGLVISAKLDGSAGLWIARGAGLVAVLAGMWRIAVAVEASPAGHQAQQPRPDSPEADAAS
ncbi:hypothetical protein G6O69_21215 [Pseudenhygromyxa sp. WMMC2535]|uniref:hypothetical protein n=1 Tax=Pseudenhygromyxa sp. WMMC2535 TaxID=2712867 RepID=UPI001551D5AF|nr:hypothetical protein [Pseudenhygromyxa sp. WMMC2535]NVB40373.1 hypothetical protein [Pseudenhygromyxa sp. WMMC2535]